MKYLNLLAVLLLISTSTIIGQNVPFGIKYNGTAYLDNGQPINHQEILVQIKLHDDNVKSNTTSNYIENHYVTTNEVGMFSLVIGSGEIIEGNYSKIPWSEQQIWISTQLDIDDDGSFDITQNEQLLAVPYAIHANSASNLLNEASNGRNTDDYWRTSGNKGSNVQRNFIGTIDNVGLRFKTNNMERMYIEPSGNVGINSSSIDNLSLVNGVVHKSFNLSDNSSLIVNGSSIFNKDVQMNRSLNIGSKLTVTDNIIGKGDGTINRNFRIGNNFTVLGASEFFGLASFRNGIYVEGLTDLDELNVRNNANIGKNLTVNKHATIEEQLTVNGQTTLNDPLVVNDVSYLNNYLYVKRDASDGNYLATFENTNNESGDGIKIKLGKKRPVEKADEIPIFLGPLKNAVDNVDTVVNRIIYGKDLDLISIYLDFINPLDVMENNLLFATSLCYMAQNVGNNIINQVNEGLSLPLTDRGLLVALNGHDPAKEDPDCTCAGFLSPDEDCSDFDCWILDDWIEDMSPTTFIPAIPNLNVCDELNIGNFTIPTFPDLKKDPLSLSTENNYILFTDVNDKRVGAISGISRNEFVENVLDEFYVLDIAAELVGLDPLQMIVQGANQVSSISNEFNNLGVEYSSGHGDYAEWLPRIDIKEHISTGDIVAVIGGKITKDLTDAEQIMAVSHRPIILGNIPKSGEEYTGNNIAFMGQIPVKVIGPIESGDYIVANNDGSGYGKGFNEAEMTLELLKYAVGRSWDTNLKNGPKLVNTVVGVSSGDYIKFLSNIERDIKLTNERLEALSLTVSNLTSMINTVKLND